MNYESLTELIRLEGLRASGETIRVPCELNQYELARFKEAWERAHRGLSGPPKYIVLEVIHDMPMKPLVYADVVAAREFWENQARKFMGIPSTSEPEFDALAAEYLWDIVGEANANNEKFRGGNLREQRGKE